MNDVEGCDGDKVKTEPDDFEEEELKKDMNDISVEVDDFKDANEALENQVEVCNDEKVIVKTKPEEFKIHIRILTLTAANALIV